MSSSQRLCTLCFLPCHKDTLWQCPEMQLQLLQAQRQGEEKIMATARLENASCPSVSLRRSQRSCSPLTQPRASLKRPGDNNLMTPSGKARKFAGDCERKQ